jgi:hypothetical protein
VGPISPPQLLDICVQLATAYVCFPDTEVVIARRGVDDAYRRIPCCPEDSVHMIFPFYFQGVRCVALSLFATFGNQDFNYQFNVATRLLLSRGRQRMASYIPPSLSVVHGVFPPSLSPFVCAFCVPSIFYLFLFR